jgi:1-acyl-sn-glycerol-3-phosphate acyltransferase
MEAWKLEPARDLELSGMARYRSPRREHGLVSSVLRLGWWSGVRMILGLVNRLKIIGKDRLPRAGPVVLVANHASHLDALVIGSALPLSVRDRLFPLAAGDVFFETPAKAAFAAHLLNALPVWRRNVGRHRMAELRARLLEEAGIYILFPEGGRSRDGAMKTFKPGVGMLVAGSTVPVIPCYLAGTLQAFPPGTHLPRFHKVELRVGVVRSFAGESNDRAGWNRVAASLEEDVRQLAFPRGHQVSRR